MITELELLNLEDKVIEMAKTELNQMLIDTRLDLDKLEEQFFLIGFEKGVRAMCSEINNKGKKCKD